ncbi:Dihydrolipoamide acyltransferase, partial [Giardia duodenalis]
VSTRPPCGDHPAGAGHRVRPAVTEAPPKPAEAAIVADLLASLTSARERETR